MSRSNQYSKKIPLNSLQGTPCGEAKVVVDLSQAPSAPYIVGIHDEFSIGATTVSCQVVSKNLTGTLNGTVVLSQSNDGENWSDTGSTLNLASANGSGILEKADFACKYLGVNIDIGNISGGDLELFFIVKHQ